MPRVHVQAKTHYRRAQASAGSAERLILLDNALATVMELNNGHLWKMRTLSGRDFPIDLG